VDDLITTRELQALLHVDRITIYRMLADGRLAGFKVGGQWRFSRRQIESWLEEQQSLSSTAAVPASLSSHSLPLSCVQAIQSVCAEALDIAAVTTDPQGTPLTEISGSCAFCNLILGTEEGRARCAASWRLPNGGRRSPTVALRTCHAGLLCTGVPVRVGEQWVATLAACQFVAQPAGGRAAWQPDLTALAAGLGLDERNLRAALPGVRLLNHDQIERIERLVERVAGTVCEMGQERARMLERLQHIAQLTNL